MPDQRKEDGGERKRLTDDELIELSLKAFRDARPEIEQRVKERELLTLKRRYQYPWGQKNKPRNPVAE